MLCGDGASSWFMYNALAAEAEILAVVVERKPSARAMIRTGCASWGGSPSSASWLSSRSTDCWRDGSGAASKLVQRYGLQATLPPAGITHRVPSINAAAVRRLLKKLDPDAVVVNGTRIISRTVIDCIERPFINTHVGITPRYRGVHGGYWALVHDDAENCGVTVHLVDAGVDTGGVLYQQRICVERSDGFNTYPLHQLAAAIPLMKQALRDVLDGTLVSRDGVGPSKLWYHPTLGQYLRYRFTKSVK
jgi:Methionyl-tRNA formyltransferase